MKIITWSILAFSLWASNAWAEDRVTCHLPGDQGSGSLLGLREKLPVLLAFDREFYLPQNNQELVALKSAVRTWESMGGP